MKNALWTIGLCLLFSFSASAQLTKTIHQSFAAEDINQVDISIVGDVEFVKWAGNTILSETRVELYDATPALLNHILVQGRYDITAESSDDQLRIFSKDETRKTVRTNKGECYEFVVTKLYIPEEFKIVNGQSLIRESKATASTASEIIEEK